jgi:thiamine biosynthesis protein ThiC
MYLQKLVIARSAFGRTRYASIVTRGNRSQLTWTETLDDANIFQNYDSALDFVAKYGIVCTKGECFMPLEWAKAQF